MDLNKMMNSLSVENMTLIVNIHNYLSIIYWNLGKNADRRQGSGNQVDTTPEPHGGNDGTRMVRWPGWFSLYQRAYTKKISSGLKFSASEELRAKIPKDSELFYIVHKFYYSDTFQASHVKGGSLIGVQGDFRIGMEQLGKIWGPWTHQCAEHSLLVEETLPPLLMPLIYLKVPWSKHLTRKFSFSFRATLLPLSTSRSVTTESSRRKLNVNRDRVEFELHNRKC